MILLMGIWMLAKRKWEQQSLFLYLLSYLITRAMLKCLFVLTKQDCCSCLQWIPVATTRARTQGCVWGLVQIATTVTALELVSMGTTALFVSTATFHFQYQHFCLIRGHSQMQKLSGIFFLNCLIHCSLKERLNTGKFGGKKLTIHTLTTL